MKLLVVRGPHNAWTYSLIDDADYQHVNKWHWRLNRNGYAARGHWNGERYEKMYLHRYLMKPPFGMEVDHINRIKLDNQRANLRVVTRRVNALNQGTPRTNTSGHKGVSWFKPAKLWTAYINHASLEKRLYLGYFKTKDEAIAARQEAERRLDAE